MFVTRYVDVGFFFFLTKKIVDDIKFIKPLLSLEKYAGLYFGQKGRISLVRKWVASYFFLSTACTL